MTSSILKQDHSDTCRSGPISALLCGVGADALTMLDPFCAAMDVRDRVIDPHAICAGMVLHQCGHRIVSFLASPVALPFEQNLLPGDRDDACLNHAVHRIFMRVGRGAAGS